jgi:ribosome maturation factor RimP
VADPVALHDRVLALVAPEFDLLGLDLVEFEVLAGGRRFTLRFSLERSLASVEEDLSALDAAAKDALRRVDVDDCARASRAIARVIEAEEAEHGEFIGRYTLEVSSPGIFRRLTRPEHFERYVGEIVKLSYEVEGRLLQVRGPLTRTDAARVVVLTKERGELEVPMESIRRANLDPDLDFGRSPGR